MRQTLGHCRRLLLAGACALAMAPFHAGTVEAVASAEVANKSTKARIVGSTATPLISYAVRYQRYGVLGFYHVNMMVDVLSDGVRVQRLYFDGAGRVQRMPITFGLVNFHIGLLPAYLDGHLNTEGHKKHFCGLLSSDEFGPSYPLTNAQGTKLLTMAHHAALNLHGNKRLYYFTVPIHCGFIELWTSNSVVASLVENANAQGIPLPMPEGRYYPGFDGPFLPGSVFE
jgi:hypothetical protein